MVSGIKHKNHKQAWLFINNNELILFETDWAKGKLPGFTLIAQRPANDPLHNVLDHIQWVSENVRNRLNLLIGQHYTQLLLTDVPDVPADEMDDALQLKAADLINFEIDDATLDFIHLPPEVHRGRVRMAYIVAAQKSPLQQWLQALIREGIKVDTIDTEITQLRNLSIYHQQRAESGVLYLKAKQSRLLLTFKHEMVLNRVFDIGLEEFKDDQSLTTMDGELEVTVEEPTQPDIQLETLALEIRRSLDYFESQLALGTISEINVLCDENYETLVTLLAKKLGVRFHLLRTTDFMDIKSVTDDDHFLPTSIYHLVGSLYREELS